MVAAESEARRCNMAIAPPALMPIAVDRSAAPPDADSAANDEAAATASIISARANCSCASMSAELEAVRRTGTANDNEDAEDAAVVVWPVFDDTSAAAAPDDDDAVSASKCPRDAVDDDVTAAKADDDDDADDGFK